MTSAFPLCFLFLSHPLPLHFAFILFFQYYFFSSLLSSFLLCLSFFFSLFTLSSFPASLSFSYCRFCASCLCLSSVIFSILLCFLVLSYCLFRLVVCLGSYLPFLFFFLRCLFRLLFSFSYCRQLVHHCCTLRFSFFPLTFACFSFSFFYLIPALLFLFVLCFHYCSLSFLVSQFFLFIFLLSSLVPVFSSLLFLLLLSGSFAPPRYLSLSSIALLRVVSFPSFLCLFPFIFVPVLSLLLSDTVFHLAPFFCLFPSSSLLFSLSFIFRSYYLFLMFSFSPTLSSARCQFFLLSYSVCYLCRLTSARVSSALLTLFFFFLLVSLDCFSPSLFFDLSCYVSFLPCFFFDFFLLLLALLFSSASCYSSSLISLLLFVPVLSLLISPFFLSSLLLRSPYHSFILSSASSFSHPTRTL